MLQDLCGIIRRAKEGDSTQLRVLMEEFGHVVKEECRDASDWLDDGSASDVMQEVWLRVWSKLNQFEGDSNPELVAIVFRKWLEITAHNVFRSMITRQRAQKRRPENGVGQLGSGVQHKLKDENAETGSSALRREESRGVVQLALEGLEELPRSIVRMHIEEELTFAEIARQLGLTSEQVRYQFHKSLSQLEALLRDFPHEN